MAIRGRGRFLGAAFAALISGAAGPAVANVIQVAPADDLGAAIARLQPGDELLLSDGTYTLSARLSLSLRGTSAAPIVIRAADGARPHLHRPSANQNIIDIDVAEYVALRGIEFSGGSAGIRISSARFLTIEDCEIHDTGDVALRANDAGARYEALRILHNHIHDTNDTGEGIYFGCNNNGCQMFDSLIAGNYIHHTNGPTVIQGDGIELKEGSYNNVIRDNVIHDTNYPCILTYSTVGNGAANIIERNAMWNCGDHGIQTAADAVVRNNIILGAGSDGIAMQPHQSGSPANLTIAHNTVLNANNDAISLRGASGAVTIANNAVYARRGSAILVSGGNTTSVVIAGNVGQGGLSGFNGGLSAGNLQSDVASGSYAGAPPIDLFPAAGGNLIGAADPAHAVAEDFNGTARPGSADVGAYRFARDGNPGWTLQPGFKTVGEEDPGGEQADAGPGRPGGADAGPGTGGGPDGGDGVDNPGGDGSVGGGCRAAAVGSDSRPGLALLLIGVLVLAGRRRSARRRTANGAP